ncbi:SNF2 family N-terminal domain-containing protein [Rostrohypoxylon terebratum]|nr:SNF2 family N-terminal domain-containing protein [Rostrohypoxylon terebratum]
MRLLHVQTKKLEEFFEDQIPPYAILSHRWEPNELTYKDVANRSKFTNNVKIDGCCKQAILDGIKYVWIDTICIDKSSSSEFSESINSMFAWYRDSQFCYAYLSDVISEFQYAEKNSLFRRSKWFLRGWTLQELLAPRIVRFYTKSWKFIGSNKSSDRKFCGLLQDITAIPREVLNGSQPITQSSVATRMRWAANRRTTRKEDIAYCLLGLFGVNMSLLYGEGENAFKRLQEEIIRQSDDESIFAWGLGRPGGRGSSFRLLAKSPADFMGCDDIRVLSGIWPGCSMRNLSHYSMTNKGLLIERPFRRLPEPFETVLMPLDCTTSNQHQILALPLVGNLTTDAQLRAGPGTKPVLVSARIFETAPISRVYLRSSEWTMPYECGGFYIQIEQYEESSTLQLLDSYPTSCTGINLGNAQPDKPVEIIDSLRPSCETSDSEESTASQVVLFRLRGANDRIYLVRVVMSFQQQFGFDYRRVGLEFGVLEEPQNASLAEFILEEYSGESSSCSTNFQPHSPDGYLQLSLDDSSVNWVLKFRVGFELSPEIETLHNGHLIDLGTPFSKVSILNNWLDDLVDGFKTKDVLPEMAQPLGIRTRLERHQAQGLWFMMLRESQQDKRHVWQSIIGPNGFPIWVNDIDGSSQESFPPVWRGGILADTTGLGKTLQMISLIVAQKSSPEQVSNTMMNTETIRTNLKRTSATLVVLPEMAMASWCSELKHHVSPGVLSWTRYNSKCRLDWGESDNLPDVVLVTYRTIASEYQRRDVLFQYHWHRIIVDEAHSIRNAGTITTSAIYSLAAKCRWAVTGTPIHTKLEDLVGLLRFLAFKPYSTRQSIEQSIVQTEQRSMTLTAEGTRRLDRFINSIMIRRDAEMLTFAKPHYHEVWVELSTEERERYQNFKEKNPKSCEEIFLRLFSVEKKSGAILLFFNWLRLLCNLGVSLSDISSNSSPNSPSLNRTPTRNPLQVGVASNVVCGGTKCATCGEAIVLGNSDDATFSTSSVYYSACFEVFCTDCATLRNCENERSCSCRGETRCTLQNVPYSTIQEVWNRVSPTLKDGFVVSSKVQALITQIQTSLPKKSLVFSTWDTSLDMVQEALDEINIEHVRIDNTVSSKDRDRILKRLETEEPVNVILTTINTSFDLYRHRIFGISQVHWLEPQWNPALELQATKRIQAMRRESRVIVKRYIVKDSIEEARLPKA